MNRDVTVTLVSSNTASEKVIDEAIDFVLATLRDLSIRPGLSWWKLRILFKNENSALIRVPLQDVETLRCRLLGRANIPPLGTRERVYGD